MTDQPRTTVSRPQMTFHARVAGVALITTVVVLVAACLTFMLQQWAVAREQNHQAHRALSEVVASAAAPALAAQDRDSAKLSIATLGSDGSVTVTVLKDASGATVARYFM